MGETQPKRKTVPEAGLTRIPPRIHCAATRDGAEEPSETDTIMVDSFIEEMAEVAMAVAQRRLARVQRVK